MADNSKPVYLKLRDIIAASILDGVYAEGDMLPSVRAFAAEQQANPLTVAKAYQMFQDQGLVEVQRGSACMSPPAPSTSCVRWNARIS